MSKDSCGLVGGIPDNFRYRLDLASSKTGLFASMANAAQVQDLQYPCQITQLYAGKKEIERGSKSGGTDRMTAAT